MYRRTIRLRYYNPRHAREDYAYLSNNSHINCCERHGAKFLKKKTDSLQADEDKHPAF